MQGLKWEPTSGFRRPQAGSWATLVLCCALGAVAVNMLTQYSLLSLLAGLRCSNAAPSGKTPGGSPWQWGGPHQDAGYWFDEFQDTLSTMQSSTFWNGTYWPATIQWIGAFLDTLVAASDRSFTNALEEYGGDVPGAHTSTTSIQGEIQRYFSDVEAYYGDEDVIQIFGAAYDGALYYTLVCTL